MSNEIKEKEEISAFVLAEAIAKAMQQSGASKKRCKEAMGLIASQYGLRLVPVGVPLERRGMTATQKGEPGKGTKAPKQAKSAMNADPTVRAAQAVLDRIMGDIQGLKKAGKELPPQLVEDKNKALAALKAAKDLFGRPRRSEETEHKAEEPKVPSTPAAGN